MSEQLYTEKYTFDVRRCAVIVSIVHGVDVAPDRYKVAVQEGVNAVIEGCLHVATIVQPMARYPRDWWQAFKERWFPVWLKVHFPVKYVEIVAVHKFPELDMPVLGREFIHLEVIDYDEYVAKAERRGQVSELQ